MDFIPQFTGGPGTFSTISASGVITSTVSTGTAPFVVASTTVVANLNAALLNGTTWTAPGAIGAGTPSTAAFTTTTATSLALGGATIGSFANATTGSQSLSGGLSVGHTTLQTGGVVITSAISANKASSLILAYNGGGQVLFQGADTSTNGIVSFISQRSNASNTLVLFTNDTSGNVVFATIPTSNAGVPSKGLYTTAGTVLQVA